MCDCFIEVDDLLVVEVPAALGRELILDLEAGRAGRFDLEDGPANVQRSAEAGVDVGDHWDVDHGHDTPDGVGDIVEADQPEVGLAQRRRRQGEPRQVGGLEAGLLDEGRAERVGASGCVHQASFHQSAQSPTGP